MYTKAISLIKTHITANKDTHELGILLVIYKRDLCSYYNNILEKELESHAEDFEYHYNMLIKNIKTFVKVFKTCLYIYYEMDVYFKKIKDLESIFNSKNNFSIFTSCLIFDTQIDELCLKYQNIICKDIKEKLQKNMNLSKNFNPNQLGVDYCKKILEINFDPALNSLRNIEKNMSPILKLQSLIQTIEELFKIVENVLIKEENGENFKNEPSKINHEKLMSFLVYFFSKSNFPTIFSHFNIIESFINDKDLVSYDIAFYFSILKAAVLHLSQINFEQFEHCKSFKKRNSLGFSKKVIFLIKTTEIE